MTQPDGPCAPAGGGDGGVPAPWAPPDDWQRPSSGTVSSPAVPPPAHPYLPAEPSEARTATALDRALLAGLALLLILSAACAAILWEVGTDVSVMSDRSSPERPDAQRPPPPGVAAPGSGPGTYTVVYEVTGTGRAYVLYTLTEGSTVAQMEWVTLPWRLTTTLDAVPEVTLRALTEDTPGEGFGCRLVVGAETATDRTPDESNAVTCQIRPRPENRPVPSLNPHDAA